MTLYRYGLLMRPPVPGALPKLGLMACEEVDGKAPSGHHIYGTADYSEMLFDEEVEAYELEYMGKVEVEE